MLKKIFGTSGERTIRRYRKIVHKINAKEIELQKLSDDELKKSDEHL